MRAIQSAAWKASWSAVMPEADASAPCPFSSVAAEFFERLVRRIGVARIAKALFFVPEDAIERFVAVVEVCAG